jgi:small subunit ribosomal protein S2
MTTPSLQELLAAGVHFGHQESRWHPKTKPYIFGVRNGIHIIDLEQTQTMLKDTMEWVRDLVARGGVILFLGTKRQARAAVRAAAEECGMPYVTNRWLGGTLTNFPVVYSLVKRYLDLRAQKASGELAKYTKKEQSDFAKEIGEMEEQVGGIESLTRIPDALFVIDVKKEKTAVAEAQVKKVPVVALLDTNVNPALLAHAIPSNDDAVKTIELMSQLIAEAVNEGKAMRNAAAAQAAKPIPETAVAA